MEIERNFGRQGFFKVISGAALLIIFLSTAVAPNIALGSKKKSPESFSRFGINNPFEEDEYGFLPEGARGALRNLRPGVVSDSSFRRRIEKAPNNYDWISVRNKLSVYKGAGAERILFVINPKSNFLYDDGFEALNGGGGYLPGGPLSFAAYENYLTRLVKLGKGKVDYWEIFNEPADEYKISKGVYRINDYVELVAKSWKIIKSIDPQAQVVLGGIATRSPLDFYELVLTELKNYYPEILSELIFDVHTYSWHWQNWDRYYERGSQTDFRTFETFANLFKKFVDSSRFIIKESGTFSGRINDAVEYPFTSPEEVLQTEYEQAEFLFKSRIHLASQPGVMFVQWSTLGEHGDYHGNCESKFSHGGLIYDGTDDECGQEKDPYDGGKGVKKLGYYSLKYLIEQSRGGNVKKLETGIPNVFLYYIERNGAPLYIAWRDYYDNNTAAEGREVTLNLSEISNSVVKITEAIPNFSGDFQTKKNKLDERDYPKFFKRYNVTTSASGTTIILGRKPVYIE